MLGLRTQEGSKFEKYFALVQEEAEKLGSVFFLDCGEGNEFETDTLEGEDLRGWLICLDESSRFEKRWLEFDSLDEWEEQII